jgi:hypothetical protein
MKLYGIAEIAEALGVDRYLVAQWYRRARSGTAGGMDLPEPSQVLYMGPVWTHQTISPWLRSMKRRHGR